MYRLFLAFLSPTMALCVSVLVPQVAWPQCDYSRVPELLASDGAASDHFGYSVAMSGDVAIFGAPGRGAAYVFRHSGAGWVEEQKLFGSNESAGFGTAVAIDGNIAVVMAPLGDVVSSGQQSVSGATYIFRWNGSSWLQEQKLLASAVMSPGSFGNAISSISVSGNVIVVGAAQDKDELGYQPGAAHVYRYDGSSWVHEQKLLASGSGLFGRSVSASGDTIVIGAGQDYDRVTGSGSAHVFRFNGSSWVVEQKLVPADNTSDAFGQAVAVSGNLAVVGAPRDSSAGVQFGSAHVFRRSGSTWTRESELYASGVVTGVSFGDSVAVSGNRGVIGAYPFRFDGSNWIAEARLLDLNGVGQEFFGSSVAVSGNVGVIGAYGKGSGLGAAYVFDLSCPAPNLPPLVSAGPDQTISLSKTTLDGTVSDDGQPINFLSSAWSKVSGPGVATFDNMAAVDTGVSFTADGTYVLRLTADDGGMSVSDEIQITHAVNQAPTVSAGPDQTITLPANTLLNGSVIDDGLPRNTINSTWSMLSGPGIVSFGNNKAIDTTANFSAAGTYVLQLRAQDYINSPSSTDDVQITVNPASGTTYVLLTGNIGIGSGTVTRNPNQSSYAPGTVVTLTATPAESSTFMGWIGDLSGSTNPATITMNANKSVNTNFSLKTYTIDASVGPGGTITPSGSVAVNYGNDQMFVITSNAGYKRKLVLADGNVVWVGIGLTVSYTFTNVTANHTISVSYNQLPIVSAGPDQTISLPANASLHGTITDDGPCTVTWTQVSGPGIVSFGNMNAVDTTASFSLAGTYVLSLRTADNANESASDNVQITVNPASGSTYALITSGPVTRSPNQSNYAPGTVVTLTANPAANSVFTGWSGGALSGTANPTTLRMDADKTVQANYAVKTYTLTASAGANGRIRLPGLLGGVVTVPYGSERLVTLIPNIGYQVADVLVDGVSVGAAASYTFANVTANHTISVSFSPINQSPTVSSSSLPNGFIDPLEDRDATTGALFGIKDVSIIFSVPVKDASNGGALTPLNFTLGFTRNSASATDLQTAQVPIVSSVTANTTASYTLHLSSRIPLGAWTKITAVNVVDTASGTAISPAANSIVLGFLPMDVTQDGRVLGEDINRWLAIKNGSYALPAPLTPVNFCDQTRDGGVLGNDIARAIQLINGTSGTTLRAWSGFDMGAKP